MRILRNHRVPVILQMSATECGAACLAMILSYHGRHTEIDETRRYCRAGRDGINAETIVTSARKFGLRTKAYSIQEFADIGLIRLPAIIHWKFNHFVVLEKWNAKKVQIIDPALGRRIVSIENFRKNFTGIVLTFEPGAQFETQKREKKPTWLAYYKNIFQSSDIGKILIQIIGSSLILQVVGLTFPLFSKVLIDQILPNGTGYLLPTLGIGILFIVFSQATTSYLRNIMLVYVQTRLDAHIMLNFFEHLLYLPYDFFTQRTSGDLLLRLGNNSIIRDILINQLPSLLLDGSFVVGYLVLLLFLEPIFGLSVLIIGFIQIIVLISTSKKIRELTQKEIEAQAQSQTYLIETLKGIVTIKSFGAEERVLEHWSNLFYQQLNISLTKNKYTQTTGVFLGSLQSFSSIILLWIGAWFVLNQKMSLGTLMAINTIASLFLAPLSSIVSSGQQIQIMKAFFERINDVIRSKPEQNIRETKSPTLKGKIELKNICFRYNPEGPDVIQNLSMRINSGDTIAIVGPTGSGKTTIMLLLLGLYRPDSGEILYDNTPLHQINYQHLRNQIGVITQTPYFFNGTIFQNISMNDNQITLDCAMEATQFAEIHKEIACLPMGYETRIAEGGAGFSGGQLQRLAIARALVHKPSILLLDEATSHLDAETERKIQSNLSMLSITQVIIAHRINTIQKADLIYTLQNGRIVEKGTHEELLSIGKHYSALVGGQQILT